MGDLMPWHKTRLVNMEYDRVDLVKEGANSQAHIRLFKNRKGGTPMELEVILKSLKPEHSSVVKAALEAKDKQIEEALAKAKAAEEAIAKVKPSTEDPEEILKSVTDPNIKALLETQIMKAKAAEDEIKKMQEVAVNNEAIAKAKEVPNLGAEEQALVDIYKKLKGVDDTLCDEVFGIFKSASALAAQGGTIEIGKSAAGGAGGQSANETEAWAKIEKAAEEIAKTAGISKTKAVSQAIKDNPELYAEYTRAQRA